MKRSKTPKKTSSFVINTGEGRMVMETSVAYGTLIHLKKPKTYNDLNFAIGREGLKLQAVRPLIGFLELANDEIAALVGISTRTLARWRDDSPVGVMASKSLLELDRLIQKGIDVFGGESQFKSWLRQPNTALGDVTPLSLLIKPYGSELVEDALDAMDYGNAM